MTAGNRTDLRVLNSGKFDDILEKDVSGSSIGAMSGYIVLVQTDDSTLNRINLKDMIDIFTA